MCRSCRRRVETAEREVLHLSFRRWTGQSYSLDAILNLERLAPSNKQLKHTPQLSAHPKLLSARQNLSCQTIERDDVCSKAKTMSSSGRHDRVVIVGHRPMTSDGR